MNKIILASNSNRRKDILSMLTDDFTVISSNIDETFNNAMNPLEVPPFLAIKKALDIYKNNKEILKDTIIIGADTMVLIDNKLIGKPKDYNDAKSILKSLSGKKHSVITGVAFVQNGKTFSTSEVTDVYFDEITDTEIESYIENNDVYDKAGAYAIQGPMSVFVTKIDGDYFNIVGLPINKVKNILYDRFNCKFLKEN